MLSDRKGKTHFDETKVGGCTQTYTITYTNIFLNISVLFFVLSQYSISVLIQECLNQASVSSQHDMKGLIKEPVSFFCLIT